MIVNLMSMGADGWQGDNCDLKLGWDLLMMSLLRWGWYWWCDWQWRVVVQKPQRAFSMDRIDT